MRFLPLTAAAFALAGSPALAATGPFFSLDNTDFIVLIGFIVFGAVLVWFKVPGMLGKMLDDRAAGIRSELDEARALRDEAQTLLASYERKQQEVKEQADRIVAQARSDAETAAEQAKADLDASIKRRIAAAEEQIAQAETAAVKEVRDRAIAVAVAAAKEVIAKQMSASDANKLIDDSIDEVGNRLH